MNQIAGLLISALMLLFEMAVYAENPSGSTSGDKQSKPIIIPVDLKKQKGGPHSYAPSRGVEAYITIEESGTVGFILPFESYPADVTITGEGTTMGCWTSTLAGAADVMPFDGGEGDYRLEISTPDGSYVGYFTLE